MSSQVIRKLSGDTAQGQWDASVDVKCATNAPDLGPGLELACTVLGISALTTVMLALAAQESGDHVIRHLGEPISNDRIVDYYELKVAGYVIKAKLEVTPGINITESGRLEILRAIGKALTVFGGSISKAIVTATLKPARESAPHIVGLDRVPSEFRPAVEKVIRERMGSDDSNIAILEVSPEVLGSGGSFGLSPDQIRGVYAKFFSGRNGHGEHTFLGGGMFGSGKRGFGFRVPSDLGGGFGG